MENFWVKLAGTVQLIWDLSSYELHLADLKDKKKKKKKTVGDDQRQQKKPILFTNRKALCNKTKAIPDYTTRSVENYSNL